MKDVINHAVLGTNFYYSDHINFPKVFALDNYYTDAEIAIIKKKTPKISNWKKSWFKHGPYNINITDKCPCCQSKDIRRLNPYLLEEFNPPYIKVINTFQYIKWCANCNWCNSTEIHIHFEY